MTERPPHQARDNFWCRLCHRKTWAILHGPRTQTRLCWSCTTRLKGEQP